MKKRIPRQGFFRIFQILERFLNRAGQNTKVKEGKILLLDDNRDLLLIVQIILKGQGYEVVQASSIAEALQKIKIHKPSLILMDVFIQEEDGRELCSQLKKEEETCNIKIILMSGIEADNLSLHLIGADDFLAKPFEYDDLLERVQRQMTQVEQV